MSDLTYSRVVAALHRLKLNRVPDCLDLLA
jgi:hypothetical protein